MGIEFLFNTVYIKTKIYMQTITHAQAQALEMVTKELDKLDPGRGKDYMDIILGILNIEMPTLTECVSVPFTGIGNETPVKSLENPIEVFDVFDNMPKITTPLIIKGYETI